MSVLRKLARVDAPWRTEDARPICGQLGALLTRGCERTIRQASFRRSVALMSAAFLGITLTLQAPRLQGQQPSGASQAKPSDEQWRKQFKAGTVPLGTAMSPSKLQAETGKVTYTLHKPKEPTEDEVKLFTGIAAGMDSATRIYNSHTKLRKALNIYYNPGVPTANGHINGTINLGPNSRNTRVCMHEICHTLGVGQHGNWGKLMVDGRWQGEKANKRLQEFTKDPKAQLHGDRMHFWPYGLNYDNEVKSEEDFIRHAKIVEAIVEDLEDAR